MKEGGNKEGGRKGGNKEGGREGIRREGGREGGNEGGRDGGECITGQLFVIAERDKLPNKPPLLVKIAPDLSTQDKEDIAAVVTRQKVRG